MRPVRVAGTWLRRRSLRVRLVLLGSAGVAAGLALGGLLLIAVLHVVLVRSVDSASRQTAVGVGRLIDEGGLADPILTAGTQFVQVLDSAGRVRAASVGTDHLVPLLGPAELARARGGRVVEVPGERVGVSGTLRVVLTTAGSGDGARTVLVAGTAREVAASVDAVRGVLLVAYPLLVAALAALAWRVVGAALRPVEGLRAGAEEINAAQSGRLPVPDGHDEVHRLAVTLNAMLDRLEAARARQRAFVADAAHELRSPIASLRTQLDVAEHLGEPPVAADLWPEVDRLGRLVDDLLMLARIDAGEPVGVAEPVELTALLREVAGRYAAARVPVTVADDGPQWTTGDRRGLARAVDNLVGNAVRHAAGTVLLRAVPRPGGVRVLVVDDGPGIPVADRERVFDRFTRLDDARTRDDGGAGLGLAIVRELVRRHGGTVSLADAAPGVRAQVDLPAAGRPR